MDDIKKQVKELIENQNHILVAIKYLDERLKAGPGNANDKENDDVKEILASQAMIDEILVKNSDEIMALKKIKQENATTIQNLETKI